MPAIPLEEFDTIGMPIPLPRLATIGDGIYVQPATLQGTGIGLFVTRFFPAGTMITGYQGKFISRKKALMLRQTGRYSHVIRCGNFTFHGEFVDGVHEEDLQPRMAGGSACNHMGEDQANAKFVHFDPNTMGYAQKWATTICNRRTF